MTWGHTVSVGLADSLAGNGKPSSCQSKMLRSPFYQVQFGTAQKEKEQIHRPFDLFRKEETIW